MRQAASRYDAPFHGSGGGRCRMNHYQGADEPEEEEEVPQG